MNRARRLAARLGLAALLAAALAGPRPALAQPSEDAVKAAFLPKFARYVQWPASRAGPVTLCLVGRDPFGPAVDRAAARELVGGQPVAVRRLPSADGAAACHLAFVRGATPTETLQLLAALRSRPILTITDSRASPHRGVIHFTVASGRVRFFIDDAAAAERGLTISSRLLALALAVRQRRT